jgi:hypothetical protein
MFSNLMNALRRRPSHLPVSIVPDDSVARKIVAYQAQGNISLQRGLFVTEEEIEDKRRRLFSK